MCDKIFCSGCRNHRLPSFFEIFQGTPRKTCTICKAYRAKSAAKKQANKPPSTRPPNQWVVHCRVFAAEHNVLFGHAVTMSRCRWAYYRNKTLKAEANKLQVEVIAELESGECVLSEARRAPINEDDYLAENKVFISRSRRNMKVYEKLPIDFYYTPQAKASWQLILSNRLTAK